MANLQVSALRSFSLDFELHHANYDAHAAQTRADFLNAFPSKKLKRLTLDDYVIGKQRPNFCTYVETITRPWASIQGATADKFGIYYGIRTGDSQARYRFTKKFSNGGSNAGIAFENVKIALLELIDLGQADAPDFDTIDKNLLSPMFKAKILSLYFPERFLNVCSPDHLHQLSDTLGCNAGSSPSKAQFSLLQIKQKNKITQNWSNPKFMSYLYGTYINTSGREDSPKPQQLIQLPKQKSHPHINFEEVQAERLRIGEIAEKYAIEFEKKRLQTPELSHLIGKIQDRRKQPGYGYDFQSWSTPHQQRYIEVKAVGKDHGNFGYRFFLSDNEYQTSQDTQNTGSYYFYLVFFNKQGEPEQVIVQSCKALYENAEMSPASYVVRFEKNF